VGTSDSPQWSSAVTIYIRSSNRLAWLKRVQSRPIAQSLDIRSIIALSIGRSRTERLVPLVPDFQTVLNQGRRTTSERELTLPNIC